MQRPNLKLSIPQIYLPYFQDTKPVQVWYGSRFSAKSWTKCVQFLTQLTQKNEDGSAKYCRIIFARDTQKNVKNSQYQLFKDIAKRFWTPGTFTFQDSFNKIICNETRNYAIGGSFEQPDSLRSVADPTDFWAEEPITRTNSIKRDDYLDIRGSLRNSYDIPVRFHFTFNPISKTTWIYKEFFEDPKPDVTILRANYIDNPFCPQSAINYLESIKKSDPARYRIEALGEWGNPQVDAPYFEGFNLSLQSGKAIYNPAHPFVEIGLDFNNYKKGCSMVVRQSYEPYDINSPFADKTKGAVMVLEALQDDMHNLCYYLAKNYATHRLHITGDASGKNLGANNLSYFALFEAELKNAFWNLHRTHGDFVVAPNRYNVRHEQSKLLIQKVHQYYGENYRVDEVRAAKLISDYQLCRLGETGQYDKAHAERNKYGDISDAERYAITKFQKNVAYLIGEYNLVENV